jgi:ABC-type nitrate/sulfonate/bicarbonate transport system permease component
MVHSRWITGLASLLFGVLLFFLLQAAVGIGWVSPFVVPPPTEMVAAIPALFAEEELVTKFFLTLGTTLAATVAAAVVGIPFGWFLFRKPAYGQAYESWLGAAFSAPLVLLYPLFMVIFGRGVLTIFVMGMITGIIPITLHTLEGLRGIPRVYLNVAKSFKMTERQVATKVLFPAALPTIFTGIRLGLIYTMIYVVAIEFLVSIGGLGFLVGDLYDRYNIPGMYGAIIFVVLVSVLFFAGTERLERWLKSL